MSAESEHWQNHPDRFWYGPREAGRWGVYDRAVQSWTGDFTGRDAKRQASERCTALSRERGTRPDESRAVGHAPISDADLTREVKDREREEARSLVRRTGRTPR